MATDYKGLLKNCEDLLRAGAVGKTAQIVGGLNLAQVPREYRLPLAKVCRRAGRTSMGLKLLTPVILSPQKKLSTTPSPEEMTEYAVLLQRNGSVDEALRLLDMVDAGKVADANLYRAFCNFNRWDYQNAIPYLERYLEAVPSGYWKLAGEINLAAALAMTYQHEKALTTLGPAIAQAKKEAHGRIEANAHEIQAQVFIQLNQPEKAAASLERALALLDGVNAHDSVFIRKWQAILKANRERSLAPFDSLREQARRGRLFETLREADLYSLKVQFEQNTFDKLLFGTPFPHYRARLQKETGVRGLNTQTMYGPGKASVVNWAAGEWDGRSIVKPGGKIHQVISVLLRDFYKPAKVGHLFSEIFPGEYFDIFSSPDRVHQILKRTRQWVSECGLPVAIVQDRSAYHLEITGSVAFRVELERKTDDWFEIQYAKAERLLAKGAALSGGEFRKALGMTEAEYKRYLKWALENGKVRRVGGGRSTAYKAA